MADIKAVNEKFLEKKLDEDQLDMVAGGTWAQTFADANMLDFFGITSYKYNPNSRESNIVAETGIQKQYVTREDVIQAFSKQSLLYAYLHHYLLQSSLHYPNQCYLEHLHQRLTVYQYHCH